MTMFPSKAIQSACATVATHVRFASDHIVFSSWQTQLDYLRTKAVPRAHIDIDVITKAYATVSPWHWKQAAEERVRLHEVLLRQIYSGRVHQKKG